MSLTEVVILFNIIGCFSLSVVYFYVYCQYREKYMGIWTISWIMFGVRITLDLLRLRGYSSLPLLLINQFASVGCILLLLSGGYLFSEKKNTQGLVLWGVSRHGSHRCLSVSKVWIAGSCLA